MAKLDSLDRAVAEYTRKGYVVQHSTETSAQLYRPYYRVDSMSVLKGVLTLGLWLIVEAYRQLTRYYPVHVYLYLDEKGRVRANKTVERKGWQ